MRKSIHWTLQLWHALLLVAVVIAFGATLGYSLKHARFAAIDKELQGEAEVLAARLRPNRPPPPPPIGERGPRPEDFNGGGPFPDGNPPPRPGPRRGRPEFGPRGPGEFERNMDVPPEVQRRFSDGPGAPYFAVWRPNGSLLRSSRPLPELKDPPLQIPLTPQTPPQFRQRGNLREVMVSGPGGSLVLVGRSIAAEQAELRQLVRLIALTGLGVTILGLAGGWLLARRAMKPIAVVTEVARGISASNLSRRIDESQTPRELAALAGVLNDMFARLEASFQRQVRFTADASHELRTPLTVIHSHAELALTRERSAPEYRQAIEACLRASKRMKSLIESLLVLARADAGRLELKRERFDLAEVTADCAEMIGPLAKERNIAVQTDLQPTQVEADRGRISQLVTNLLSNSVRYNRDGGGVMLTVTSQGPKAIVSVADTGVGISEQDQPHLFERFFRADKARSREAGGSGLGLAICQSIVEAHGGTISFTSRPGEGTTFTIELPRAIKPAVALGGADGNGESRRQQQARSGSLASVLRGEG